MWYYDLTEELDISDVVQDIEDDLYWNKLEDYWYKIRPHNIERDFEELSSYELDDLKRNYKTFVEMEEQYTNPERFYMTGGL